MTKELLLLQDSMPTPEHVVQEMEDILVGHTLN